MTFTAEGNSKITSVINFYFVFSFCLINLTVQKFEGKNNSIYSLPIQVFSLQHSTKVKTEGKVNFCSLSLALSITAALHDWFLHLKRIEIHELLLIARPFELYVFSSEVSSYENKTMSIIFLKSTLEILQSLYRGKEWQRSGCLFSQAPVVHNQLPYMACTWHKV